MARQRSEWKTGDIIEWKPGSAIQIQPSFITLPSNHYLISMQQITLNFIHGSLPVLLLKEGKLLSSAAEWPAVVNTAILRRPHTNA